MAIQPYLFFEGRCEEALEFYRKALGAEVVMLMRYKDSPEPAPKGARTPPGDKVMHSSLRIGDAELMASDGFAHGKPSFQGFSLSLNARDDAEARRWFNALADGGRAPEGPGRLRARNAEFPGFLALAHRPRRRRGAALVQRPRRRRRRPPA